MIAETLQTSMGMDSNIEGHNPGAGPFKTVSKIFSRPLGTQTHAFKLFPYEITP
jgi:hypothetical protein